MSADPTARLRRFADLLLRWNTTLNLIAARDAGVMWDRHIPYDEQHHLASMARHQSGMTVCYWLNKAGQSQALLILVAWYEKLSAILVLQPATGT